MNNNIKEILDGIKELIEEDETPENMKKYVGGTLNINELKTLLDYITNLQKTYQNAINQSIVDHKYASKKEDEAIVLQEERKTLYRYTPEKGFRLVGEEDVKDKR